MDGVSGVLAVVSLSLQLVDTVQKANRFLKRLQNAPKESARLIDALNQLESLLIAAHGVVEQQNKIGSLPGSVQAIDSTLQRCKFTVEKLETAVKNIETFFKSRGRGRKAWASLKTVVRKEELEKLHKQVLEDMNSLQTALLLNLSYLQLYQFESRTICSSVSTQGNSLTAVPNIRSASKWGNPNSIRTDSISSSETIDVWNSWGFFGWVKLEKKTKVLGTCSNTAEKVISQENCLLFIPSLIQTGFEIRYHGGFFQVPRTLTSFPVLPYDAKEFQLCGPQHMDTFKQALSRREISPFARSEQGNTLLHYASICNHAELCSLLIQFGVDPNHTNIIGNKALHQVKFGSGSLVDTMRVLATAQDDLTLHDFARIFEGFFEGSPESADFLLSAYGYPDEIDWREISDFSLLRTATRMYGSGKREWDTWIRKLLLNEADIHSSLPCTIIDVSYGIDEMDGIATLLDEVFYNHDDPFQATYYGKEWLIMLMEAGYDVNAYLKKEKQLHSTQRFLTHPEFYTGAPRRFIFEIGENSTVYWEWWIDPSSPASLVRQEFSNINLAHHDYQLTKHNSWEATWPFDYPHWSENCAPIVRHYFSRKPESFEWKQWRERANKAASRHARQAKKYPGYSINENENSAMPGAWIEDGS